MPKACFVLVLASLIFSLFIVEASQVMHLWESLYIYHAFGSHELFSFNYWASPGGNMGLPGYAFVEIIRPILISLNSLVSLSHIRVISIVPSLIVIFMFYRYTLRRTSIWIASLGTCLLIVNPLFYQIQHSATVVMVSLAGLLLVIDCLDSGISGKHTSFAANARFVSYLTISGLLVFPHYGMSRLISLALILIWTMAPITALVFNPGLNKKSCFSVFYLRVRLTLISVTVLLLLALILDSKNIEILANPLAYILPPRAETFVNVLYKDLTADVLTTIRVNAHIIFESVSGIGHTYHSPLSGFYSADLLYPIGSKLLFLPFILGLCSCFVPASTIPKDRNTCFFSRKKTVIFLFILTIIPSFMSAVLYTKDPFVDPSNFQITLHSTRLIYSQFSYYCIAMVGLELIIKQLRLLFFPLNRLAPIGMTACLLGISFLHLYIDNRNFSKLLNSSLAVIDKDDFNPKTFYFKGFDNGFKTHPQNAEHLYMHSVYRRLARDIDFLRARISSHLSLDHIYYVDMDSFDNAEGSAPSMLQYMENHAYHSLFLTIYTASFSKSPYDFFQVYGTYRNLSYLGFTKQRELPLRGVRSSDESVKNLVQRSSIRTLSQRRSNQKHIITTSEKDLMVLKSILSRHHRAFKVHKVSVSGFRKFNNFYN